MINLKSKITRKVLSYFFLNIDSEFYLNEIAKKFEVDRGNLVKKLSEWEREGILEKNKRGNLSLYKINKKYQYLSELQAIFRKSFGVEKELYKALKNIKGLKTAILFGSYTRGKLTPESDIDLLLVGSHNFFNVQKKITQLQKIFDREINVVDMDEKEFTEKQSSAFIRDIMNNPYVKIL
jgi:predicted nucleotidyltransferase